MQLSGDTRKTTVSSGKHSGNNYMIHLGEKNQTMHTRKKKLQISISNGLNRPKVMSAPKRTKHPCQNSREKNIK
jgi:hypothetical protein